MENQGILGAITHYASALWNTFAGTVNDSRGASAAGCAEVEAPQRQISGSELIFFQEDIASIARRNELTTVSNAAYPECSLDEIGTSETAVRRDFWLDAAEARVTLVRASQDNHLTSLQRQAIIYWTAAIISNPDKGQAILDLLLALFPASDQGAVATSATVNLRLGAVVDSSSQQAFLQRITRTANMNHINNMEQLINYIITFRKPSDGDAALSPAEIATRRNELIVHLAGALISTHSPYELLEEGGTQLNYDTYCRMRIEPSFGDRISILAGGLPEYPAIVFGGNSTMLSSVMTAIEGNIAGSAPAVQGPRGNYCATEGEGCRPEPGPQLHIVGLYQTGSNNSVTLFNTLRIGGQNPSNLQMWVTYGANALPSDLAFAVEGLTITPNLSSPNCAARTDQTAVFCRIPVTLLVSGSSAAENIALVASASPATQTVPNFFTIQAASEQRTSHTQRDPGTPAVVTPPSGVSTGVCNPRRNEIASEDLADCNRVCGAIEDQTARGRCIARYL
ncbi:MAG: hypothetical protein KJ811_03730 [Candidatus Margulisbacteria bacterium]|nr:hypothetical protein [Candidatus Margulisiibacteriota bacterium]